jgi:hypothetical protein
MPIPNLEEVIQESVEDVELTPDGEETPVEDTEQVEETPTETDEEAPGEATEESAEVASPATQKTPPADDFDKKHGISSQSVTGRENRIPYSRVKKIAANAAKEAVDAKEKEYTPRIQEFETKVKDYENRLNQVAEFEKVMFNDPDRFFTILSGIPAYKPIFEAIEKAFTAQNTQPEKSTPVQDDMPPPDYKMPDGTMVYSLEGLKKLNEWNRVKARKETLEEVNKKFGPMLEEREVQERINSFVPQVRAQIEEARTWELFNENETEIVKVLRDNPRISLEGAYRQVVLPKLKATFASEREKLSTDRNKIREEILAEIKKAPKTTSVKAGQTKTSPVTTSGPRNLEDVILEQVQTLK